ncbi:hypothetical protein L484_000439 [Morus notabilis]|uniref:Uncharacterized protein n=1 Tax=Morus notabilis TaxID=981085 RepID=W9RT11_9ROSA|nr:hypothetical protein L484_000439 [Morus notabilis]
MVTSLGVVTGPIIRHIEALFVLYNCHGNGENLCCRNGAGPSDVTSKLSSRSTTGTRMVTTFGVKTGPISR